MTPVKTNGKAVVLVSGGSRGLGGAIVSDLLDSGNIVATFSRTPTPLVGERQHRDPDGAVFSWESVDASDPAALKRFALGVARKYGRIDVLINNAAVASSGVFTLARTRDVRNLIAVNLEAAICLAQTCAKVMLKQSSGVILNVSSVNAVTGNAGVAVYSATKAALDGLTRSLAREFGPQGIRVNSVAPGYFESEMVSDLTPNQKARIVRRTPLGRLGESGDIVGVVRFLMSNDARFITGQTMVVDGGLTC
jgi:3-oxoacyl-[acyl-carrier protein] reductase